MEVLRQASVSCQHSAKRVRILTMKRKLIALLLVMSAVLSGLAASDVEFVFGGLDQHAEVIGGFLPTFLKAGAGYNGASIIEGNKTQISFLAGGGYSQRKVWQNPEDGDVIYENPVVYDTIRAEWELGLAQGFGQSLVPGKDLVTFSLAYIGRYEKNVDSFKEGETRDNNGDWRISSLDGYIGKDYQGAIYPDLRGNREHLGTSFSAGLLVDLMDSQKMYDNGFEASVEALWAPLALNKALDGVADYYSLTFNAVGAWAPFISVENGRHWFSLTFIDRVNVNWTDGDEVPVYAQYDVSLGRKVRGFTSWTYNTQFTAVNNFDIRLAGPSVAGIFPRINLFFDIGYGCGNYFNTETEGDNLLMSTGVQFTVSFFDFIDLGYQVAYLFKGDNFVSGPEANVTGRFTFFLDF